MSNFIDALAQYLQDEGYGTVGSGIFKYRMPPTPDNCICVYPAGGPEGLRYIDINYPTLQVRVRNVHPASGYNILQSIHNTLHGLHTTLPGGVIISDTYGIQSQPALTEIDDKQRVHHIIQFSFTVNR